MILGNMLDEIRVLDKKQEELFNVVSSWVNHHVRQTNQYHIYH